MEEDIRTDSFRIKMGREVRATVFAAAIAALGWVTLVIAA